MQLIRFANIYFLYGLLLIPVFIILFLLMMRWKRQSFLKFGELPVIKQLFPDISRGRPILKFIFILLAYILLIFGLSDPQIGSKLVKGKRNGIDLIIALDISNSMLAEDIKPNRLEAAKHAISRLIDKLQNDRIGIIIFAGKSYTLLPVTTDYRAAKMFLSTVKTDFIPIQGTAIGSSIEQAIKSFEWEKNNKNKAIIIITDGENFEDDALEAAKMAYKKGIFIHTIGMGTPEGAPIPNKSGVFSEFKKDKSGNTVITKLDEIMLQQIAATGKGSYVRATNADVGLGRIIKQINKMEKNEFESRIFSDYEDRFQYFIFLSLFLLVIEFFIFEKRSKWERKINLFSNNK